MADRDRIPLVWAVPTRRGRRGEFWAFFPTLDQTTLSGVVNAPWKLNEDRTRIIEGPFNAELIERVGLLVLENLSVLCPPEDPGVLLNSCPRGSEAAGWADGELTRVINDLAKISQTAPSQDGRLMFPSAINLHPEGIPRPTLALWSEQKTRPKDWAHPSVETVQRRARLEMYMGSRNAASIGEWLEALIPDDDLVAGSVAAITVASSLVRMDPTLLSVVQRARIILDEDTILATLAEGIFRRAPLPVDVDVRYVHPDVEAETDQLLANVGLRAVDSERILKVKLLEESAVGAQTTGTRSGR